MVATDIASRGLDTDNVNLIINYDFPLKYVDYECRMGRIRNKKGVVVSFVRTDEEIEEEKNVD